MAKKGFTIVELLIVIVVIAILAMISTAVYGGISERARDSRRLSDADQIAKGLTIWSLETGMRFAQMNTGNGGSVDNGANGWYDNPYGSTPSTQSILENGSYVVRGLQDPKRDLEVSNRWRYLTVPCTADPLDNRRIVLMELERAPAQTIAQQVALWGCDHYQVASYAANYRTNYAKLADAR